MPICYFDANYEKKYRCEYEITNDIIEVNVEYDITSEVEDTYGIRAVNEDTKYQKRDILIVDYENRKNYLLKQAYYTGNRMIWGTPDGGSHTKFRARIYFEHGDNKKIEELPKIPKTNRIRIYSKVINDIIGYPSMLVGKNDGEHTISLSKNATKRSIEINSNNIKKITVSDEWNSIQDRKEHSIRIDFSGYIELELGRRENYDLVNDFVTELKLYMQLYMPDRFQVEKMYVMIEGTYYRLFLPEGEMKYKKSDVEKTVQEELLIYLKKCYMTIPYRKSKTEFRNIPYIVMRTSRSIEDNFLMFYRFIECYYKKQQIPGIVKTFVKYGIIEHYAEKHALSDKQVENYAQEIICLRNHYVHAGYFIRNASLKVSFEKINRRKNPKDYTVNDIDIMWIYERTKILYEIVLDIIFNKMLGYTDYNFSRHF